MADHADESFMDKVKHALGMGTEHRDAVEAPAPDEGGWAGVPEALDEDLDVANRPMGPDYGHREHTPEAVNEPMPERREAVDEQVEPDRRDLGI